jgi:carboxypeptidase T
MSNRIPASCVALLWCAISMPALAGDTSFVVAKYRDRAELQAIASQFQHLIVDEARGEARVEASREEVDALRVVGIDVRIDKAMTAKLRAFERSLRAAGSVKSIPGFSCYRTVEETYTTMSNLVAAKPMLASIVDIGPSFEKSRNASLGYTMKVLRINNSATDASIADKPSMVVFASIHAREYTPAELITRFAEWLLNGYGTDPEATWLVDHHRFHLVLQGNPDGRKKAETGISWRKNTNNTNGSCAANAYGTDLNRNFPFHWGTVPGGSSGDRCNETYRGPLHASEPETQNLIRYVAGTPDASGVYQGGVLADRRADSVSTAAPSDYKGLFIDVHSFSQLVLWPWGDRSSLAPNGPALRTLGRRLAWFNGYSPEQSSELYATDGATDDNFYGSLGAPAYTLELGVAFFESCSTFQNSTLPNNLAALKYAARNLQAPYTLPSGPDTVSVTASTTTIAAGGTLTVTASVNDSRFNQSNGSESVQNIASAIATVDLLPWQAGAVPIAMTAVDGAFNASSESVRASIATTGLAPGQHRVYVQATDAAGKPGTPNAVLFTVTPGGGNIAPVANFSFVANGLAVNFSDGSVDSDGSIVARSWTFGDGGTSTATNPAHAYAAAGTYAVTLTVTDNDGATHAKTSQVTVTTAAQSFFQNLADYPINDNSTVNSPIVVSGRSGNAPAALAVAIRIVHTYQGDLKVDLVAPDGTLYNLHNRTGGGTDNIVKTVNVNASSEVANGTWNLRVNDNASADTGYIDSWSMQF